MPLDASADGSDVVVLQNGRVVTPTGVLDPGRVTIDDGEIGAVGEDTGDVPSDAERIDARGRLVLPGLVDLHGDDIERHLFPRPEARAPLRSALVACDRANAAAGVTTKFHAIAFEDAPDDRRTVELARELVETIEAQRESLLLDTRIHARCELGDDDAVETVTRLVGQGRVDLVSLMNHLPGRGQFDDREAFVQRYADGGGVEQRRRAVDGSLPPGVARLLRRACATNTPVASHDDERAADVERAHAHGVSISEYPLSMEAAQRATALGMTTIMGSPNLVRGGSLWGNLSVAPAIAASTVDALCSDYRPESLLESVFVETGEPLPERVARVTERPAAAAGLDDRGRIEQGARADLLLVDTDGQSTVDCVFRAGRVVYRVEPAFRDRCSEYGDDSQPSEHSRHR